MDIIEQAISRASDTKAAVIGKGAISKTPEMFRKLFGDKKAIVVADVNTYAVVGKNVIYLYKGSNSRNGFTIHFH